MTGQDLLTAAAAQFGASNTEGYTAFAPKVINNLLAETFDINNRMRHAAGKDKLEEIPLITGLAEEITYETKLIWAALVYGLAAKLISDERDAAQLSFFYQAYKNGLDECDVGYIKAVTRGL